MKKVILGVAALCAVGAVACVDDEDTAVAGSAGSSAAGSSGNASGGSSGSTAGGAAGKAAGGAGAGGAGAGGKAAGGAGAGGAGSSGASGAGAGGKSGSSGASGAGAGGAGAGGAGAGGAGAGGAGAGGAGAGGAGAGGAGGSAGTGGSTSTPCLDVAAFSSLVTIGASELCVTRVVTTDEGVSGGSPSWGLHGGPLTSSSKVDGEVSLVRWTLPAGATGAATTSKTIAKPTNVPSGIFWGGAVDLGPLDGTLLSYTGTGAGFPGEVLLFSTDGATQKARANVNGFFSGIALPGASPRLVYSGLSPLASAPSATSQNGLWAGDYCGGFVTSCAPPANVGSWAASSGPVITDGAATVFADQSTFGGDHEIRAFSAEALKGSTPGAGVTAIKNPNFVSSVAALRPTATEDGWLFVEESDPATFTAQPLVAVKYKAGAGSAAPTPGATVAAAISPAPAGKSLALFGDGTSLWIAIDTATGGAFVEVKRK